jgi:hypothetical protein
MPIRSRGDAGTIQDLGLPNRAVSALSRAGVTRIDALAALTRQDLAAVPGLGAGMINAIRLVVPEPPTSAVRSGASPVADDAEPGPAEEEEPAAPVMPSFDSLRGPRRRSAVDLLMPEPLPGPDVTGPAPTPGAPRPAEYADLLLLGKRGVRAAADVTGRVARWWLREPVRCLRRLLGQS